MCVHIIPNTKMSKNVFAHRMEIANDDICNESHLNWRKLCVDSTEMQSIMIWQCIICSVTMRLRERARARERERKREKMATNFHVTHITQTQTHNDNSKIKCSASNFYIYLMHGNFNHEFESSNEFRKFHLMSCNRLTCVVFIYVHDEHWVCGLFSWCCSFFLNSYIEMKCNCVR